MRLGPDDLAPPGAQGAWHAALNAAEGKLHALTQVSLQAQCVLRAGKPVWLNPQFADLFLFDSPAQALAAASLADLFAGALPADPAAGVSLFGRRTLRRRDGESFRAEIYARHMLWEGEDAVAMAILDVSCEERAIVDLADARRDADLAALARRQLLAAAADDLHTPLLEAIAALGAEALTPAAKDARTACRALLRCVEDALAGAERDADAHAPVRMPFDAAAAIAEAAQSVRDKSPSTDIVVNLTAPVDPRLVGDRACTRALVRALLEEGARRTSGEIICDAEIGPGGVALSVHVARAEEHGLRDGLRVARPLAAAMGGAVFERRAGEGGWTALAYLPLAAAPAPLHAAPQTILQILVADDQPGARRILDTALTALGHCPTIVASGAAALEAAHTRRFDLVLLDLNMPGLDGCETARRLRKLSRAWATTPIAAITASQGVSIRTAAAEAGMDAILEKPVSVGRLAAAIAALMRAKPSVPQHSVQPAERREVQNEHQHDEAANDINRDHDLPAFGKRAAAARAPALTHSQAPGERRIAAHPNAPSHTNRQTFSAASGEG